MTEEPTSEATDVGGDEPRQRDSQHQLPDGPEAIYRPTRRGVIRGISAVGVGIGLSSTALADDDDEDDDDDWQWSWGWSDEEVDTDWSWDWDWDWSDQGDGDDVSLLFSNNWLVPGLELPTIDLGWFGTIELGNIGGAPQIERRAAEIGGHLDGSGYDVVAMCENFRAGERAAIENGVSDVTDSFDGPGSAPIGPFNIPSLHSGLHTFTTGETTIEDTRTTAFDAQGDYIRDADFYGNKGVQYTEVDVGPGKIDLFSTHLIAGGGIGIDPEEDIPFASPPSKEQYRAWQIREARDFILETQKSENVTVVVGDFNVDAVNPGTADGLDLYSLLTSSLADANCYDAWERHGGPVGTTSLKGDPPGGLERAKIDPENPEYFEDYGERRDYADVEDKRIDYVFVQEEQPSHSFEFDVDSIRRRHFWREKVGALRFWAEKDEVPNYASDHVALELNLTAY